MKEKKKNVKRIKKIMNNNLKESIKQKIFKSLFFYFIVINNVSLQTLIIIAIFFLYFF